MHHAAWWPGKVAATPAAAAESYSRARLQRGLARGPLSLSPFSASTTAVYARCASVRQVQQGCEGHTLKLIHTMRWRGDSLTAWVTLLLLADPLAVLGMPDRRTRRQIQLKESFIGFERPDSPPLSGVQKVLYNYLEPKPIVDTISEREKYGNQGDVLGGVGRGLVNGVESITSVLASAVSVPGNIARRLLKRVSDSLNNVGSRIVGLK